MCKVGNDTCKNNKRNAERSWAFAEEYNEMDSEREMREYGEMMERERVEREKREYRKLLARKDGEEAEIERGDTAMDGVDGEGEGDEKLQEMKEQCRMRRRALDRLQICILEDLDDKRARFEEENLERDELDRSSKEQSTKAKLQQEKQEAQRRLVNTLQNAKLGVQSPAELKPRKEKGVQPTLSKKKMRAAELGKMKAIR